MLDMGVLNIPTLIAVIIGGFIVNLIINWYVEWKKRKKTQSILYNEFCRIDKILVTNRNVCRTMEKLNVKISKSGKSYNSFDTFYTFNLCQHLIVDTIVLHSLILNGSILKLSSNEVNNIQAIVNELLIYNKDVGWFLDKLKTIDNINHMNKILNDIDLKTGETVTYFESKLNFGWFDKDEMIIEVRDEINMEEEKISKNPQPF